MPLSILPNIIFLLIFSYRYWFINDFLSVLMLIYLYFLTLLSWLFPSSFSNFSLAFVSFLSLCVSLSNRLSLFDLSTSRWQNFLQSRPIPHAIFRASYVKLIPARKFSRLLFLITFLVYAAPTPKKKKKENKTRRQRTTFTSEQTLKLELEFHQNEYITRSRRFELAACLKLTETQVLIEVIGNMLVESLIKHKQQNCYTEKLQIT